MVSVVVTCCTLQHAARLSTVAPTNLFISSLSTQIKYFPIPQNFGNIRRPSKAGWRFRGAPFPPMHFEFPPNRLRPTIFLSAQNRKGCQTAKDATPPHQSTDCFFHIIPVATRQQYDHPSGKPTPSYHPSPSVLLSLYPASHPLPSNTDT